MQNYAQKADLEIFLGEKKVEKTLIVSGARFRKQGPWFRNPNQKDVVLTGLMDIFVLQMVKKGSASKYFAPFNFP